MILTCPDCSTRFLVDSAAIGRQGRRVKCGKCGHGWFQEPGRERPTPPPPPVDLPPPRPVGMRANLPAVRKRRGSSPLGWVALAAVVLIILIGGFLFRVEIVNVWPPAAKLYATIGLPVDPAEVGPGAGLNLRVVSTAQEKENGTPVLVIEGEVANDTSQVMDVPEMRAALTAEDDSVLHEWQFAAENGRLLPGRIVPVHDPGLRPAGRRRQSVHRIHRRRRLTATVRSRR